MAEPQFGAWTRTTAAKPSVLTEVLAFYRGGSWGRRYFNGIAWFSDHGITEDPIAWMPAPPDPDATPGVPAADATAVPLDSETGKPWTPADQAAWEAAERERNAGVVGKDTHTSPPPATDGGKA